MTSDGTLGHPLYQTVVVAGVPLDSARVRIGRLLLQYVQAPQFVVEYFVRVYVSGEVRAPGAQAVPASATLLQVMAAAGGPTDRARLDRVVLVRRGAVTKVDLTRLGDPVGDMPVFSGDQVVVKRRRSALSEVVGPIAGIVAALAAITTIVVR